MDALDEETLRRKVVNVVEAQQQRHKVVEECVKKKRERQRQAASRGQLPNFAVGDYGKGTAAGFDAKVGEHVERSLANCNGG